MGPYVPKYVLDAVYGTQARNFDGSKPARPPNGIPSKRERER